jgi:hypothetical protein
MKLEEIDALANAMSQLLDDMGKDGHCVSGHAKAQARIAFEPWCSQEDADCFMSLVEAQSIVEE